MNRWFAMVFFVFAGCDCRGPRIVNTFDGCSMEVCDGTDNDCDGEVDEAQPDLTCGAGSCARTVSSCAGGETITCTPGVPNSEVCNGLDDDCDGQTDEDLADLTCGIGACARAVPACDGGACLPGVPEPERCDGEDNDCDGIVDDGVCRPPTVTCPLSVTATVGSEAALTAQASAGDSPLVSTQWAITRRPMASLAQVASPGTTSTTFQPDNAGLYTFSFCATDSAARSACCMTGVTTQSCSSPPAPPATTACGTSWDGRPVIEFSPVPTGLRYEPRQAAVTLKASANPATPRSPVAWAPASA